MTASSFLVGKFKKLYVTGVKGVCYWSKRGMLLEKKGYVTGEKNFLKPYFMRFPRREKFQYY